MSGRVTIETTDEGVRVRMPAPRSRWSVPGLLLLIPIAAYVALGNVVFVRVAGETMREVRPPASLAVGVIVLVLLVLTDVPVLLAAWALLYHAAGRETIVATPWMLDDSRGIALARLHRHWPALRVSDLRLAPMAGGDPDERYPVRRGILFEMDGKRTLGIAEGCTPREAAEVLAAVSAALTAPCIKRQGRE